MVAIAGRELELKLYELQQHLAVIALSGNAYVDVIDVTHDSRQSGPGVIFTAIAGDKIDGNDFVSQALDKGAVGVMSERAAPAGGFAVWIQVPDARRAMSRAAAVVHGDPSKKLK